MKKKIPSQLKKSKKLTTATESRQSQPNYGLFDYLEHQHFPDGNVCFQSMIVAIGHHGQQVSSDIKMMEQT